MVTGDDARGIVNDPAVVEGYVDVTLDLRAEGCTTVEELDRLLTLGARHVDIGQGADKGGRTADRRRRRTPRGP